MRLPGAALVALGWLFVACVPPRPPNVVLITLDTTRFDALGVYGESTHTPRIDAFARESVLFEHAVSAVGLTLPSHASILTGLYPKRHGVTANQDVLEDRLETLAERLASHGYETGAFVSFGSMLSRGGFHQGFDTLSARVTGRGTGFPGPGGKVNAKALPWLREEREGPFFVWLHYFEAHTPYVPTPWAREQLGDYDGLIAEGVKSARFRMLGSEVPWEERDRWALRVLYDGKVRELDVLVAEVLDTLDDAGIADDTVVVLTADHGQLLGEHARTGHAFSLFEEVIRVPLLIRSPRHPGPQRVETRVGLVDLVPTILDLAGAPVPPDLDGRSLLPLLRGDRDAARNVRYYAEVQKAAGRLSEARADTSAVAIYRGPYKSVRWGPSFQTYDLARDPGEESPLSEEELPDDAAGLREVADAYYEGARRSPEVELTADMEEELRALGYLR